MSQQEAFVTDDAELAALLERSGDLLDVAHTWPKTLAELTDVLCAHFVKTLPAEQARDQAEKIIIVISHHLGGRMFYLPRDEKLRQALRDDAIWRRFDGANVVALARAHDLTPNRIYQIIAEQRALHRKKNQPELF